MQVKINVAYDVVFKINLPAHAQYSFAATSMSESVRFKYEASQQLPSNSITRSSSFGCTIVALSKLKSNSRYLLSSSRCSGGSLLEGVTSRPAASAQRIQVSEARKSVDQSRRHGVVCGLSSPRKNKAPRSPKVKYEPQ